MEYVWSLYGIRMELVWNNTVATPGFHHSNSVPGRPMNDTRSFRPALLTCLRWRSTLLP